MAASGNNNSGLGVAVNLSPAVRSGPTPIIIATLPPDGSTTPQNNPLLQVIFNIPMDTTRTDISMVSLPTGLTATALVWIDPVTLEIQYSGTLPGFGAKRVGLVDRYFISTGNMHIPLASGYAFNYDIGGGGGGGGNDFIAPRALIKLILKPGVTGKDSLQFTGIIELPKGYDVGGKVIDFDIGGVTQSFTLDGLGKAVIGKDKVQVKRKLIKGAFLGGAVRILLKMKGTFSDDLIDEGLINITTPITGVEVFVNVAMILGTDGYATQLELVYKAKAGKSGKASQITAVK